MNNTPLFTIILAGYQTEPYLQKALDSVANQTFRDFEAICYVEECTDNSLEICRTMAERDSRFIASFGPKSGGVGATRNYGIEHASGEYLIVLDGDDWIMPDMLEKLANKLRQTGQLDVLSFAAVSTESEDFELDQAPKLTNFSKADEDGVFSGLDAFRRIARRSGGQFRAYTVLSTYRIAFLREHHLRQQHGVMEDFESTPRIWYFAERMAYLDEIFYVYRRRANSLTTEASARAIHDLANQLRSLMNFAADNPVPDDILSIWSNQWISILFWFMFHPVTSQKVSDTDRVQALNKLFVGEGKAQFLRILPHASRPKRLAKPLILLAAKGFLLPAKIYFSWFYYPMIERRGRK